MKLRAITLKDVRRFTDPVRIDGIADGVNVLCAPNEFGKSTVFDALRALFFVPHSSRGKEIGQLRPHAGGAPEVTVEIETPEGIFHVSKRWLNKPEARVSRAGVLIAQADVAEAWIGQLLGGGDGGPSGLLWVRQGLTSLADGSNKEQQAALDDLFMSKSARDIEDMVKNMKSLMQGGAAVILVLSGTERLAEISSYDSQIDRRFTKIIPKDLVIGTDNDAVDGIIRNYCERAGVTFNPDGAVVSRLIHASRNRFGRAIETTINAIEQALLDGDLILDRQHFAEAWAMKETTPWDRNIFVAEAWRKIELDVQAKAFEAARTARQLRRLALG